MKLLVKKGRTSFLAKIFIQDSSSATGAGLAGLTSASSGLVCHRARDDDGNAAATQITLSGGTRGTWSSGGFKEKDATNMPGVYELGIPDAALASGSETAVIMLKGATNMAPCVLEIQLVAYDPQDSVRAGLTALPNAAAAATGGLPTVDANDAVKVQSGTGANQISLSSGLVGLQTDQAVNVTKVNGTSQTAVDIGNKLDATVSSRLASASYSAPPSAATIAAAVFATVIETGFDLTAWLRLAGAALFGKAAIGTTTATFRDTSDTADRITATVDADGNRTVVTLDPT
jgi:hypothetical protein